MNAGLLAGNGRRTAPLLTAPKELAYASSTSTQTGISTVTDLTGLSISFTVVQFAVEVELFVPYIFSATSSVNGLASITDAANTVSNYALFSMFASGAFAYARVIERITTPGTYTRKGRIERSSGTGTISVNIAATTVSHIKATEIRR